jgi:hypothetical protein
MDSTTTESGTSVPEAGSDSTAQDAPSESSTSDAGDSGSASDGGGADGGPSCMAFDAGTLDDAAVAAGLAFIESAGHCNHCHQSNPDAGILLSGNNNSITDAGPVYPPNLTPDPATGLGCWTNDQIANAILYGIDPAADGGLLCGLMPKFGVPKGDAAAALNDASVYNVVDLLRSLPAVSNQVPQTMCPALSPTGSADAGDAGDGGTADAGDAATE